MDKQKKKASEEQARSHFAVGQEQGPERKGRLGA
jgi:hypothetical protein